MATQLFHGQGELLKCDWTLDLDNSAAVLAASGGVVQAVAVMMRVPWHDGFILRAARQYRGSAINEGTQSKQQMAAWTACPH